MTAAKLLRNPSGLGLDQELLELLRLYVKRREPPGEFRQTGTDDRLSIIRRARKNRDLYSDLAELANCKPGLRLA